MHRLARTAALVVLFLFTASTTQAQWSTVGAMRPAGRTPASLTFRDARSIVSVTAESHDIIRVRFSPTREFGRDHSYAVLLQAAATHAIIPERSIHPPTSPLRVTIRHAPFRLAIADAAGDVLDEDDSAQACIVRRDTGHSSACADEHVYGCETDAQAGRQQGGYAHDEQDTRAMGPTPIRFTHRCP